MAESSPVLQTYDEVIASNPAYSAEWYASRLRFLAITLLASGVILLSSFFFLAWFHISGLVSTSLFDASGLKISTNGSGFGKNIFVFPLLWLVVVGAIVQVGIGFWLFWNKVLSFSQGIVIRLSFGVALLVEINYMFVSFFDAFPNIKLPPGVSIGASPSTGTWIAMLVTIVAGIIALALIPGLLWTWKLAIADLKRPEVLPPARAARARELKSSSRPVDHYPVVSREVVSK